MIEGQYRLQGEFLTSIEIVAPVVQNILSDSFGEEVLVNASDLTQPIQVSKDKAQPNFMQIQQFLVLSAERWKMELHCLEEALVLKDYVINEFDKLCNKTTKQNIIDLISKQKQAIINAIFDASKVEKKQIASDFCMGLANGFENDVMKNFDVVAYYVLWGPLFVFPLVGLTQYIGSQLDGLSKNLDELNLKSVTSKIISFIQNYFKPEILETKNFESPIEFAEYLQKLASNKKTCTICINSSVEYLSIVQEFRLKCIQRIALKIFPKKFVEIPLNFVYDDLELMSKMKKEDVKIIFEKISNGVKTLNVKFSDIDNGSLEEATKKISQLKFLKKLDLDFSDGNNQITLIGLKNISTALCALPSITRLSLDFSGDNNIIDDEGIQQLSEAIQNMKLKHFDFNVQGNKNIMTDKSMTFLSTCLKQATKLSNLRLLFGKIDLEKKQCKGNGIVSLGHALENLINITDLQIQLSESSVEFYEMKAISSALKKMKNLKNLNLDLTKNEIQEAGMVPFSKAIWEMEDITRLSLNFCENSINQSAIQALSFGLQRKDKIIDLTLNLDSKSSYGLCIENEGMKALSNSIKKMKSIKNLTLHLAFNKICAETLAILVAALKETKTIEILNLSLYANNISNKGAKMVSDMIREMQSLTELDLNLYHNYIGEDGLKEFTNAFDNKHKITKLKLNFEKNGVGDISLAVFGCSLKEIKSISTLLLNFSSNKISDAGVKDLSKSLAEMKNIKILYLNFSGNQVTGNGKQAIEELKKACLFERMIVKWQIS